jgi:hypothetical protein
VDDGYVYWMDKASGSIGRISLDRSDFEPRFIQTGAQLACGLAVDQAGPAARVIRLGKPKRNKQRGTAKLPVTVPGSGALKLRPKGHGLKRVSRDVHSAGKVRLPVTPRGRKKNRLNHHGRARVEAQITFTPTNGSSTTRSRKIKLVKR